MSAATASPPHAARAIAGSHRSASPERMGTGCIKLVDELARLEVPREPDAGRRDRLLRELARHRDRTGLDLRPFSAAALVDREGAADDGVWVSGEAGPCQYALPLAAGTAAAEGLLFPGIAREHPGVQVDRLRRLLQLSCAVETAEARADGLEGELDDLTDQLSRSYEELSLFHTLTRRLQVSRDPSAFIGECVHELHRATGVDAAAIAIDGQENGPRFTLHGGSLIDRPLLDELLGGIRGHDWAKPYVRNGRGPVAGELGAVALVPVREGGERFGWVMVGRAVGAGELGSQEANLIGTVATVLATHLRNSRLYREREEMLLGFVLSLVGTLDARDHYTCGHSERVAIVAHRIATARGFSRSDLDTLYLSGLLHDLGKIGIDDAILRKPGRLTDEEFAEIKRHPVIGHDIIRNLRGLNAILPGVRSHHENWDGSGLPGPAGRRADPPHGPRDGRGRRLRRNGQRPPLPQGDAGRKDRGDPPRGPRHAVGPGGDRRLLRVPRLGPRGLVAPRDGPHPAQREPRRGPRPDAGVGRGRARRDGGIVVGWQSPPHSPRGGSTRARPKVSHVARGSGRPGPLPPTCGRRETASVGGDSRIVPILAASPVGDAPPPRGYNHFWLNRAIRCGGRSPTAVHPAGVHPARPLFSV